jgi:alpha-tubulin suppressor-like RCC1 family protein
MSAGLTEKITVAKLRVGGMHSAIVTPQGQIYSWGNNDEGALGREGPEDKPVLVDLPRKVTDCSLGDSHSLFYNSADSTVYYCGLYRVRYLLSCSSRNFSTLKKALSARRSSFLF